jgi:hypothetical protein
VKHVVWVRSLADECAFQGSVSRTGTDCARGIGYVGSVVGCRKASWKDGEARTKLLLRKEHCEMLVTADKEGLI